MAKKKHKQKKKGSQLASKVKSGFSSTQQAGASAQSCPLKKKTKPCNLTLVTLTEPEAQIGDKPGSRSAQIKMGQVLTHNCCPALLPPGGVFQITAPSAANPPRSVTVAATIEAVCSGSVHPELSGMDSSGAVAKVAAKTGFAFSRAPMFGDGGGLGFWALLNSIFEASPVEYPFSAATCGVPSSPSGTPVAELGGTIQVYPADQFELELSLPAILRPESLSFDTKTTGWTTYKDYEKEGVTDPSEFKSVGALAAYGSDKPFHDYFGDLDKKQDGSATYEDGDNKIEVTLTQADGDRELVAPTQDLLEIIRAIRSAEYAFKQIQEWLDDLQIGPGVSFKVDCQFFAGKVSAKWGYTEYNDDRLYFAYSGGIHLVLVKGSMDVNAGFKCAGFADLYASVNGECSIGLDVEGIAKTNPDDPPKASLKPEVEGKFEVGVQGSAGWVVKAKGEAEFVLKVEADDFKVLCDEGILSGTVVISMDPVVFTISVSMGLVGKTFPGYTLIKGPRELARFNLS